MVAVGIGTPGRLLVCQLFQLVKMIDGIVYKIVDKRTPDVVVYVGSTTLLINERWKTHKYASKFKVSDLYKHIRNAGGIEHFQIVVLESGEYKDKKALRAVEETYRVKLQALTNMRGAILVFDIKKWSETIVTCECGARVRKNNLARHKRRTLHQKNLERFIVQI